MLPMPLLVHPPAAHSRVSLVIVEVHSVCASTCVMHPKKERKVCEIFQSPAAALLPPHQPTNTCKSLRTHFCECRGEGARRAKEVKIFWWRKKVRSKIFATEKCACVFCIFLLPDSALFFPLSLVFSHTLAQLCIRGRKIFKKVRKCLSKNCKMFFFFSCCLLTTLGG